jgi:hypothetical protein
MVGVAVVEAMQEDLVEADFMAEVLEDITVVDGTEEAVTGEDVATTPTEDTPIPTSVFVGILTLTGIGQLSVIPMAGATGSGCRIIEGKGSWTRAFVIPDQSRGGRNSTLHLSAALSGCLIY